MTAQRNNFTLMILIFLAMCHAIFAPRAMAAVIYINDEAELAGIGSTTGSLSDSYELKRDLNLSSYSNWTPIGTYSPNAPFIGTFDGKGYTISNLKIDRGGNDYVGLFGFIEQQGATVCEVKNVNLTNVTILGGRVVGGLVGWNRRGTVSNCTVTGSVLGYSDVGGLVGSHILGQIKNSTASGIVSGDYNAGGLVGFNGVGEITDSAASGSVSGIEAVGGLAGHNEGMMKITNSAASGSVSGNYAVGGLVGYIETGTITNSTASGRVSGNYAVGGLVGYHAMMATITNSAASGSVSGNDTVGGLVGYIDTGTITNSTASGRVSGNTKVGGIVGLLNSGTITDNVFDRQGTGQNYGIGSGTGSTTYLLTANMTGLSLPSGLAGAWTPTDGYYPQPTALMAGSGTAMMAGSGASQQTKDISALAAVPVFLDATDASDPDASNNVRAMFYAPSKDANGKPITWSEASGVLSSNAFDGFVHFGWTADTTTDREVELEAKVGDNTKIFRLKIMKDTNADLPSIPPTPPPTLTPISAMKLWVKRVRYDGSAHSPVFLLIDPAARTMLREGTDYDADGKGARTEAGSYPITATGKGAYFRTKTANFIISKRPENVDAAALILSLVNSVNSGGFGLHAVSDGSVVTITDGGGAPVSGGGLNLETMPGVTIIWKASLTGSLPGRLVSVNGGGDIKIAGGSIINEADGGTALYCEGSASMESGVVSANGYAASAVDADGKFTFSGGVITADGKYGTAIFAVQGVTVTGGKVSAGQGGAAVLSMSDLRFTGGGNDGSSNNGGGCDAGTPGVIALLAAAMIIRRKQ